MNNTYDIHFDRIAKTARYEGFGRRFEADGDDAYRSVARSMTDAGMPDGPAVCWDERGMACLTIGSVHAHARRYRPTEAQKAGDAEYRSWFPKS